MNRRVVPTGKGQDPVLTTGWIINLFIMKNKRGIKPFNGQGNLLKLIRLPGIIRVEKGNPVPGRTGRTAVPGCPGSLMGVFNNRMSNQRIAGQNRPYTLHGLIG